MITIKQLLAMPIGEKVGGFAMVVKTTKKKWETPSGWIHQVVLTDQTGDMLADVNIGINSPLTRTQELRIVVSEIQAAEQGTKLYVDQFVTPTITEPPDTMDFAGESKKVIRGKIKTWFGAACLQAGTKPADVDRKAIESLVDWAME